jgi:hypothetical protein
VNSEENNNNVIQSLFGEKVMFTSYFLFLPWLFLECY